VVDGDRFFFIELADENLTGGAHRKRLSAQRETLTI
jgi:hypothetical protein